MFIKGVREWDLIARITLLPLLFALCSHSRITFDRGKAETPDPVQPLWWTETQLEPTRLREHCSSHPLFDFKAVESNLLVFFISTFSICWYASGWGYASRQFVVCWFALARGPRVRARVCVYAHARRGRVWHPINLGSADELVVWKHHESCRWSEEPAGRRIDLDYFLLMYDYPRCTNLGPLLQHR